MNEQCGKDYVLQRETSPGVWETLGGLQTKSQSMNNEMIDVTNHGSNQDRTLLDGCGIRSMSVSGSGVYNGDSNTLQDLEAACLSGVLQSMRLIDEESRSYTGMFKVTTFERASEYNGACTYSITLESSGAITIA